MKACLLNEYQPQLLFGNVFAKEKCVCVVKCMRRWGDDISRWGSRARSRALGHDFAANLFSSGLDGGGVMSWEMCRSCRMSDGRLSCIITVHCSQAGKKHCFYPHCQNANDLLNKNVCSPGDISCSRCFYWAKNLKWTGAYWLDTHTHTKCRISGASAPHTHFEINDLIMFISC